MPPAAPAVPADAPIAVTKPHAVAPPAPPKPPAPPPAPPVAAKPPAPAPPVAASDATQYIVAQGHSPAPDGTQQMRKVVGPGVDIEGTQMLSREALGDAARAGGTGFFRRPDALSSGEHEVGHTFVMPAAAGMAEKARRIEEEGEPIEVSAHRPFLLDDVDSVYYVVEGGLLIFTVALEKGAPVGQRTHFLGHRRRPVLLRLRSQGLRARVRLPGGAEAGLEGAADAGRAPAAAGAHAAAGRGRRRAARHVGAAACRRR